MGVLATRSAHARPSAQTHIDMNRNFSAHVSACEVKNKLGKASKTLQRGIQLGQNNVA